MVEKKKKTKQEMLDRIVKINQKIHAMSIADKNPDISVLIREKKELQVLLRKKKKQKSVL